LASLKEKIHAYALSLCEERIVLAENELKELSKSAAEDTKSSAGDKYETGRDMINLEKEKVAENLAVSSKMKSLLSQIDPAIHLSKVRTGSLVRTEEEMFFISTSLGKITIDGEVIFAISPISPIAQVMLDLVIGDSFTFNGKKKSILDLS